MSVLSSLGQPEFLRQLEDLAPPGRAFSRDPDTVQHAVFTPPANALAAAHAAAMRLLEQEADPALTSDLLGEWETDYGLPDPCTRPGATPDERRAALLAKIASLGGQSAAYFTQVAAAFGYTIDIIDPRPSVWGRVWGLPFGGPGWAHVWIVKVLSIRVPPVRFDNTEFECRMRAVMPAHTVLIFDYGPALAQLYDNGGVLCLTSLGGWPSDATGLAAGAVYSNGLVASVVPGVTPNPAAPPVIFGTITAAGLLALGGGDLPWSGVTPGSGQLYNPGGVGEIWVA